MTFQEFIDSLSAEDRKVVFENLIQDIKGNSSKKGFIVRKTAKLSTLDSDEEIKRQISSIFGIPAEKIDAAEIRKGLTAIDENYEKVTHLTNPLSEYLKAQQSKPDKLEELTDIGRFLIAMNLDCSFVVPDRPLPYPDFIVSIKEEKIGIEHTRLLNSEYQKFNKTIKYILQNAEKSLREKNSSLTQIVNLSLNYYEEALKGYTLSTPNLSKNQKNKIAEIISTYILELLCQQNPAKPSFIANVDIATNSVHPISVVLIEKYLGRTEFKELLGTILQSKESKYDKYSTIKNFTELWLVIILNGVSGPSSYVIEKDQLEENITSKFEKIYLFDTFSQEVTLLHSKNV